MQQKTTPYFLKSLENSYSELQSKIDRTGIVEEKPTFTISPAPKLNFGMPISSPNTTNFKDMVKPTPVEPKKETGGFSLVPKANAMEEKDLIQTYLDDNNVNVQNREVVFEMLKDNVPKEIIEDAIINKAGYKGFTQEQPKEEGGFIKGGLDIGRNILKGFELVPADIINIGSKAVGSDFRVAPITEAFTPGAEQKQGLLARSVDTIGKRYDEAKQIREEQDIGKTSGQLLKEKLTPLIFTLPKDVMEIIQTRGQGKQTESETDYQTSGKMVRAGLDIVGDTFMTTLSTLTPDKQKEQLTDLIIKVAQTEGGEKAIETATELKRKYDVLKQENPRLGRNLDATGTFAEGVLELVGGGTGKRLVSESIDTGLDIAKQGGDKLVNTGKVVLQKTGDKIDDTKQSIKATKQQIESGLTKEQIKGFQSNPYQADEFAKLTERIDSPEGLSDIKDYKVERVGAITKELTDEIDKIRATKGETSKLYKEVREQPVEIKVDNLINDFETTLRSNGMDIKDGDIVRIPGSKAKNLNSGDIAKFDTLYKDILADAQKGYLTPDEILTFRKTASDLANYDATTTTTGQGIIKSIRKNIDNTAKEQVPGLKQLDEQFVDKLDEFENAIKDLVYKGGDVKGEWRSNIVNIVGTLDRANRAKLLARLDEVIPGIGERIQAIDNLPTILKSLESKGIFEKYTGFGGAFAGASVGAPIPIVGPIVGAIVGFTGGKLLEGAITGIRKNALNKILNRVSQEGKKRLDEINIKMKNKKLLNENDKEFINTLKQQFKNELTKEELPKTINRSTNTSKSMTSMNSNSNSSTNTAIKNQVKPLMLKAKESKPLPQTIAPKKLVPQIETKLQNLTKDNIDQISKSFTNDAQKLAKIKVVISEHLKKYGNDFKNYMAELVDKIADTLGTRMKFMGNDGIGVDKTKLLKGSDDLKILKQDEIKNIRTNPKAKNQYISGDFKPLTDLDSDALYRAIGTYDFDNMPKQVTLYRGIKSNKDFDLFDGDFLTKNKKIAENFAGKTGKVKAFKVNTKDLIGSDFGYEEVIYKKTK